MAYESFRRWQAASIEQKQSTSALLVVLGGAALGFSVTQLSTIERFIGLWASIAFHCQAITYLSSLGFGIWFSLNRVKDFDETAQIARLREREIGHPRLSGMRKAARQRGRITRRLFLLQIVMFFAGTMALLAFFLLMYATRLYPPR